MICPELRQALIDENIDPDQFNGDGDAAGRALVARKMAKKGKK